MREGEPNNGQSFEKVYASLQEAFRPVLTGYRGSVDIWTEPINPWIRRTEVFLPSSPNVSPEMARRAIGKSINELGIDYGNEFEIREAKSLGQYSRVGPTIAFQTGKANIVITRREVYKKVRGGELTEVIWSIENLQPMGWKRVFYEKGWQIIDRVREATVGREQYFQP